MSKIKEHTTQKSGVVFSDDGGWERIPNRLLRCPHLKPGPKMLLCNLMSYCHGDEKRYCWPSQERLAEDLGVSTRTVRNWLEELKAAGLVEVKQVGQGRTNRYTMADRCFPHPEPASEQDQNSSSGPEQKAASVPVGSQLPTNTTTEHNKRILQHQHGNNGGGESHPFFLTDHDAIVQDLRDIGMNNAQDFVNRYDNDKIRRWVDYTEGPQADSIRNPAGFITTQLRDGNEAPELKVEEESRTYSI